MSILDRCLALLAPHECVGCGAESRLICRDCTAALTVVPSRCYRCRRLTAMARTCPACRSSSSLHRVYVGTLYDGLAKDLVWKLKFSGAQAAAKEIALLLHSRFQLPPATVIVHVPTASGRVRQRGYDQAALVARELARLSKGRHLSLLARAGQAHQVGASRRQRLAQLLDAFRIRQPELAAGATILLVDDVLTTGATLETAAAALKRAGAKRVEAIVFAQA